MYARKEMKHRAKQTVKKHYAMYLIVCLIAVMLGTEFSGSLQFSKPLSTESSSSSKGLTDVLDALKEGKEQKAKRLSKKLRKEQLQSPEAQDPVFGRTRGVFAEIVNSITSGTLFVTLLSGMTWIGTTDVTIRFLLLLSLLASVLFWLFSVMPYAVLVRRFFLEGRTYQRLSPQRFLFLAKTETWRNTVRILLRKNVFHLLWCLTLIGGIIKRYSYFLVPYIAAENPSIQAKDAVLLSQKMMTGHKWQCFKLELSMLLWRIPDILTLGLSAVLFTNAYRTAVFCEYYVWLRKEALKKELPGSELLNDYYLYETADTKLLYALYRDAASALEENDAFVDERRRFSRFLADTFGIILVRTEAVQKYEQHKSVQIQLTAYRHVLAKEAYPLRLSNLYTKEKALRQKPLYYMRCYTVWSLILIYFVLAFAGWLWEVCLTLLSSGALVNRGVLHGPWLPIYGTGSLLILTVLNKLRKYPVREFFCTILLCGALEYFISVYLEGVYQGQKWWDYTGYFLNINGRICAEGLLLFGVGGLAVVYLIAPLIDSLAQRLRPRVLIPLCIVLLALFCIDQAYSARYPNSSESHIEDDSAAAVCAMQNDGRLNLLCRLSISYLKNTHAPADLCQVPDETHRRAGFSPLPPRFSRPLPPVFLSHRRPRRYTVHG